jgi:Zn-dependent protease
MAIMLGGGRNMPLFKVAGIQVSVDWSWLLALGYVMFVMVDDYQSLLGPEDQNLAFAYGVGVAFAFFASIILHEFGHAVVARRNNIGILGIDLWMLGGLARMDRDPETPGAEFRVSAAGPFVTLILAVGLLGAAYGLNPGPSSSLEPLTLAAGMEPWLFALTTLGWINVFLLFFNLIPAYPLDGGRIARAIAWKITGDRNRGTRFSARLGQAFSYILMGLGIFLLVRGDAGSGIWWILMGWFLGQSATGAVVSSRFSERLEGVTVGDVMDAEPIAVPVETTVLAAQDEFFLRYGSAWFPVVDRLGRFIGIVRKEGVDGAVEDGRPAIAVGDVLDPDADTDSLVGLETPIESLLGSETLRRFGALMVVDSDQRLCGVVTLDQVRRALAAAVPGPIADAR